MASNSRRAAKAVEVVIESFTRHWRELEARIRGGEDVASARAHAFLAREPEVRLRLARRFYSRRHAAAMAALSPDEVRERLDVWMDVAVEYALTNDMTLGTWKDQKAFLAGLVEREYVTLVSLSSGESLLDRYPGDAGYDDLYERTAGGISSGGMLYVHKSTGEAFGKVERRNGTEAIRADILEVADREEGPGAWSVTAPGGDHAGIISVEVSEG